MAGISRRSMLRAAAAVAAGATVGAPVAAHAARGGPGGGGGGGTGGGGTVLDPPVGGRFADPVLLADVSADPAVVDVALTARMATVTVGGATASLMTYDGLRPGGTIRARRDQLLRVRMRNDLPASGARNILGHPLYDTNLHTHGLHVTPGDNPNGTHGDNMMVMLRPGESTVYEYDLSLQRPGTLNFYHPHLHGSVADQMWAGMAGALVVEDETETLSAYTERVMVLQDVTVVGSVAEPHDAMMDYMHGLEGRAVTVNGVVNPRIDIAPGQVQRWRLVNACVARFFRLSLAGHTLHVVGTDGGLLEKPYAVGELLLSPGERVDLLVKASGSPSTSYKLLSLPYSRQGAMGGDQVTLATLTYGGKRTRVDQTLPTVVDPAATRARIDTAGLKRVRMDLSMGQGHGYINGISFTGHDSSYMTMSELGTWEVWEVTNSSGMDHPFHHHTNHAQVLSVTGGDPGYAQLWTSAAAWKDVTVVPRWGRVELLVPVRDHAGMSMLHCHIIEHEDIGMMGVWHIEEAMGPM
ncbi:multicopper oxidase family protein [Georgenia muralis]|uniref:FtsP/CotA-like multicopper oxidase with cupredoxin domain n=1 Tax=Georgenia muralis TaxID=154117 RepID=A0A3N4Z5S3_9MICO|nr:multicopper oxidase family protein [Georgenia muralis]RPF27314.1 FtsP/CotA-like multicopper oxidase with cupredoxin domain [Georgenia muralis]